jgi:hypothetical protein
MASAERDNSSNGQCPYNLKFFTCHHCCPAGATSDRLAYGSGRAEVAYCNVYNSEYALAECTRTAVQPIRWRVPDVIVHITAYQDVTCAAA